MYHRVLTSPHCRGWKRGCCEALLTFKQLTRRRLMSVRSWELSCSVGGISRGGLHNRAALRTTKHTPCTWYQPCCVLTFLPPRYTNDAGPLTLLAPPSKRLSKLRYGRGIPVPPAGVSLLIRLQSTCAICVPRMRGGAVIIHPVAMVTSNCFSCLPCSLLLPFTVDASRYMSDVQRRTEVCTQI